MENVVLNTTNNSLASLHQLNMHNMQKKLLTEKVHKSINDTDLQYFETTRISPSQVISMASSSAFLAAESADKIDCAHCSTWSTHSLNTITLNNTHESHIKKHTKCHLCRARSYKTHQFVPFFLSCCLKKICEFHKKNVQWFQQSMKKQSDLGKLNQKLWSCTILFIFCSQE